MPTVTFSRAVRKGTHVIITAYGESGCGKTYSLIKLGRGLVGPTGKLGLLDTETGRGLIYAKVAGGYDYAELTPPFTPERYIEAIDAAEGAGIDALIIDSGSHEWEGIGGVLEMANSQTSQSGKELSGLIKWAKPKARHKKYVNRLLGTRMHLLISLRAKEKMVQLTSKMQIPKGAQVGDIISDGFVPIQDKRFIFETTVQLFLPTTKDRNKLGVPIVEKCPEDLWGAFPDGEKISEETGQQIAEWVGGAEPVDHVFLSLKRCAEEKAGGGTEIFRDYWRGLNAEKRDRLGPMIDNLASIAKTADQEQEDRRREREASHTAFGRAGDDTGESANSAVGAVHPSDPHGAGTMPATGATHSPAGTSGNNADQPKANERAEGGQVPNGRGADPNTMPAGDEINDLLGGEPRAPAGNTYNLPRNPTERDCIAFADWVDARLDDGVSGGLLRGENHGTLNVLRRSMPDLYDAVQGKLGRM